MTAAWCGHCTQLITSSRLLSVAAVSFMATHRASLVAAAATTQTFPDFLSAVFCAVRELLCLFY